MNNQIFLLDTNSLITPFRNYYPFELIPRFWTLLHEKISSGEIIILDLVKDELLNGKDKLSEWIKSIDNTKILKHSTQDILENYGNVLKYLQNSKMYKIDALVEWSKEKVAAPWLIATVAANGYILVTLEAPNPKLSEKQPSKKPKIPDVAKEFNVQTMNLFQMMKILNFKFS